VTAPQTPVYLDPDIAEILARCYRGQRKRAVIAKAVRMLATADGHLTPCWAHQDRRPARTQGAAVTRPSSSPRGERAGRPGAHWDTVLVRRERVIDETSGPD
jgi:hypothetical protein